MTAGPERTLGGNRALDGAKQAEMIDDRRGDDLAEQHEKDRIAEADTRRENATEVA